MPGRWAAGGVDEVVEEGRQGVHQWAWWVLWGVVGQVAERLGRDAVVACCGVPLGAADVPFHLGGCDEGGEGGVAGVQAERGARRQVGQRGRRLRQVRFGCSLPSVVGRQVGGRDGAGRGRRGVESAVELPPVGGEELDGLGAAERARLAACPVRRWAARGWLGRCPCLDGRGEVLVGSRSHWLSGDGRKRCVHAREGVGVAVVVRGVGGRRAQEHRDRARGGPDAGRAGADQVVCNAAEDVKTDVGPAEVVAALEGVEEGVQSVDAVGDPGTMEACQCAMTNVLSQPRGGRRVLHRVLELQRQLPAAEAGGDGRELPLSRLMRACGGGPAG